MHLRLRAATVVATLTALTFPAAGLLAPAQAEVLPQRTHFDLQAHRGGLGLTTEETPQGFAKALEMGVSTLELDTQITKDLAVVVTHDRKVNGVKCADTGPVAQGDPMYPYVGKFIKDLTLAQIKTLDCGYQQLPGFPDQEVVKGVKMAELKDVFDVVKSHHADQAVMNIETKVEAGAPRRPRHARSSSGACWRRSASQG